MAITNPNPERRRATLDRQAGRIAWALVLLTILAIPLLVLQLGFQPEEICLRDAAKAVAGRPWSELLVLRPGLPADPHAAWQGLLGTVHLLTAWAPATLVAVSAAGLFVLVLLAPLPWLAAPEAWLASWVLFWVAGGAQGRLMLGRPFLVPMAVLLAVHMLWTRGRTGAAWEPEGRGARPDEAAGQATPPASDAGSEVSANGGSETPLDARSEVSPEARSEASSGARSEVSPDARSEVSPDARLEVSPDAHSALPSSARPEPSPAAPSNPIEHARWFGFLTAWLQPWPPLVLTALLFGLAGLVQGDWPLQGLLPLAFLFAGRGRQAGQLALAWVVGSLLAALVGGHPASFLWAPLATLGATPAPLGQVGELFRFSPLGPVSLGLLGAVWLRWREQPRANLAADPLLLLSGAAWLIGLKAPGAWIDWGYPCAVLYLALGLEPALLRLGARAPRARLAVAGGIGLAALLLFGADAGARWSRPRHRPFLQAGQPALVGWLPDPGGILYSNDGEAFTAFFYSNPTVAWRYQIGFDPNWMPAADQANYARILNHPGETAALQPWLARLRPQDRFCLHGGPPPPGLFGLVWHGAGPDIWLGRPPRKD